MRHSHCRHRRQLPRPGPWTDQSKRYSSDGRRLLHGPPAAPRSAAREQRNPCRSGSRQNNRCRHCRRCYLACGSKHPATSPCKAPTRLADRARTEPCGLGERRPTHSDDPSLLPYRNRFAPTGRTPPALKKECHLASQKAESSIRIANVRTVDMISVTPVRVWGSGILRESGQLRGGTNCVHLAGRTRVPCAFGTLKVMGMCS